MSDASTGLRIAGEELPVMVHVGLLSIGLLAAAVSAHMVASGVDSGVAAPVADTGTTPAEVVVPDGPEAGQPPGEGAVLAARAPVAVAHALAEREARLVAERPSEAPARVDTAPVACAPELVIIYRNASMKPDAASASAMDEFVAWMLEHPEAVAVVDGYANATGDPGYNLELSHKRARRVARELTALGVPAGRLTVRGFGGYSPVVGSRDTASENRRVVAQVVDVPVCASEGNP